MCTWPHERPNQIPPPFSVELCFHNGCSNSKFTVVCLVCLLGFFFFFPSFGLKERARCWTKEAYNTQLGICCT